MSAVLAAEPLTAAAFAAYGEVIEVAGAPDRIINQGLCGRYHDGHGSISAMAAPGISLFDAQARRLPHVLDMVERHPEGSQAFIPLDAVPMLVVVADDDGGRPVGLRAFLSRPGQSVNLHRGVWHGVLAPIGAPGRYAVIDRIGDGPNLEEHWFTEPFVVDIADR